MSPAFTALVRKDRLAFGALALGALVTGVVELATSFEHSFVFGAPDEGLGVTLGALALLGGLGLGLREELTRTQEFLRQRPLAAELPLLARSLPGALLVFLAPLLAGAIVLLHDVLFGGGGVGVRADLWVNLLGSGASAAAVFAAGFLAGTLPLGWPARAVALFLLLVAQLTLQSWLTSIASRPAWTLAVLAWGAALLLVARVAGRRARDLDRPPATELVGLPLAVLTLAGLLFGGLATAGWQKLASGELAQRRPWIGWTPDGRLVRCQWVGKPGSLAIVDEAGRATGEELDDDQPRVYAERHRLHGISLFPRSAVAWLRLPSDGVSERYVTVDARGARWIHLELGSLRRQEADLPGLELRGDPRSLQLFATGESDESLFLFAPGEALWLIRDDGAPRLERVELPGGARPLESAFYFEAPRARDLVRAALQGGRALDTSDGPWLFRNGEWVRPAPELYRQPDLLSEAVDPDPFTPLQRVTGPAGVTLEVRHPLDSAREKVLAGLMGLSSVLRPLPLALVSATLDYERVANERPDEFLVLFDPVLGGGYAWLIVPNVLLHVGLAWIVARELARRGLEPARRRRWILAYLVAGIWIAAWCAALETRRAWKKSRSGPAPAPLVYAPRGATA